MTVSELEPYLIVRSTRKMPAEDFLLGITAKRILWNRLRWQPWSCLLMLMLLLRLSAYGQTCQDAADMDAPVRSALEAAAMRYFDMTARGDAAALKQNSIPAVAASFGGIEDAVKENHDAFTGAKAT